MNTYKSTGTVMTFIAAAAVTAGLPVQQGQLLVVPHDDAAIGESFDGTACGEFSIAKDVADATTEGQILYWDDGNSRVTTASAIGLLQVGVASEVTLAATTPIKVRLDGIARLDVA